MAQTEHAASEARQAALLAELQEQLRKMREENAALREQLRWRDRWIREMREALDALRRQREA
jgi:predicted nuclease with TOPRIM domain